MHILFLSDNFPPEVNAPASRTFEHCREWVRLGHQVTVITCAPNFPKGKVFAGYRNKPWQSEEMDGIRVIRVWSYITANSGFVKRILDYQSFMATAVVAAWFVRKVDVVIGTSPQFFTACAAFLTGWLKRVPYVFELRDLWPESIRAVGAMHSSFWLDVLERLELFLYRRAALVVSVTHSFKRNLVDRGIEAGKIAVVTNGVDSTRFKPQAKDRQLEEQLGLSGKFVAGYVGTHGMAHGLETLLQAARRLQGEGTGREVVFLFLGDGANKDRLVAEAEEMGLANVRFLDSVPKEQVARYWSLLDVAIIHLRKTPLFTTVIPSKLFECMGMGIPVLHGVAGESAEIVLREGCGRVFAPENERELAELVCLLRDAPDLLSVYRQKALAAARKYDRQRQAKHMLALLPWHSGRTVEELDAESDTSTSPRP